MRFRDYLERLFSAPTSISLVRALVRYKGKVFTIRSLSKVARVSSSQSAVIIGQLERVGIVMVQPVGRALSVSLNEKSYVLNKILKPIIRAEEETLNELLSILRKYLGEDKKIISAVLFGSVAKHEDRENSDIDVLVISNDFDYSVGVLSKARDEISLTFGNRLSTVIMNERELIASRNGALIKDIETSHIKIAGKEMEKLLGRRYD